MKIIGVNGVESDGSTSTDLMGNALIKRGFDFYDLNQARRSVFAARWKSCEDALDIVDVAEDGDYVLCHSYGCLKSAIAAQAIKFKAIFMFRPAMSRGYDFDRVKKRTKIYCIYSKQDYAILFGSIAFAHPFGSAGRKGFKDKDIVNIASHGLHSHDFEYTQHVDYWSDYIADIIHALEGTTK